MDGDERDRLELRRSPLVSGRPPMSSPRPATPSRVRFRGSYLHGAQIGPMLYECSRYPPDPMAPDSSAWGHDRAGALRDALLGTPLESTFKEALASMLRGGDWRSVWLASGLCRVSDVPAEDVDAANSRFAASIGDLPAAGPAGEAAQDTVRGLWCRYVTAGQIAWRPELRGVLHGPDGRRLLGGALLWDHDTTLVELAALLAKDGTPTRTLATAVCYDFRRSEVEQLVKELAEGRSEVTPELRTELCGTLQWYLDNDRVPDTGPVRWLELIRKSGHSRRGRLPHVQAP